MFAVFRAPSLLPPRLGEIGDKDQRDRGVFHKRLRAAQRTDVVR